jgi:hypothetical protein
MMDVRGFLNPDTATPLYGESVALEADQSRVINVG